MSDEPVTELDGVPIPPLLNLLAGIEHQLTRIADSLNRPTPTITAEQAIDQWPLRGGMYNHLAVGYLEGLGVAVEQEPTHRV